MNEFIYTNEGKILNYLIFIHCFMEKFDKKNENENVKKNYKQILILLFNKQFVIKFNFFFFNF